MGDEQSAVAEHLGRGCCGGVVRGDHLVARPTPGDPPVVLLPGEPEEHPSGGGTLLVVDQVGPGVLAGTLQRTLDPARRPVAVEGQPVALTVLPQPDEGGGHHREHACVAGDRPHDLVGHRRVHGQPGQSGRFGHDAPQVFLRRRADEHRRGAGQARQGRVLGEPPVEVGPQHEDDASGARGRDEQVGHRAALDRRDLVGPGSLGLVDHEQLGAVRERFLKAGQRFLERDHDPDPPAVGAWDRALRQPGEKPGADHRGLPGPGRPHHHDQSTVDQGCDQLLGEPLPAHEELGVRDVVPGQPLVGAGRPRDGTGREATQECGVLREHLRLEGAQPGAGLDAQLVVESGPCPLVGGEGVRLAAEPVQADHEQLPRALQELVLADQALQLCDRLAARADREQVLGVVHERPAAQLLEPRRLRERVVGIREICERLSAPELQGSADDGECFGGVLLGGGPRVAHGVGEAGVVHLRRGDVEAVAADGEGQARPRLLAPEGLAETRDVALQGAFRRGWRLVAPDSGQQAVDRDGFTGTRQEGREESSLDGPVDSHRIRVVVIPHLQGAKHPEQHARNVRPAGPAGPDIR